MTRKATQRSRGNDPTGRREEDPVDGPELRLAAGPPEHPELVTEDEDLEVLRPVVSATMATGDDEPGEDADREVQEGEHQAIVGTQITNLGFRPPRPRGRHERIGTRAQHLSGAPMRPTKAVRGRRPASVAIVNAWI